MVVVDDTRAAALPAAGQSPTDLSNATGLRNDRTSLWVRAHERHEFFAFRVRHHRLHVLQEARGFNDRHRRIRHVPLLYAICVRLTSRWFVSRRWQSVWQTSARTAPL